jgi:hypothetical protein
MTRQLSRSSGFMLFLHERMKPDAQCGIHQTKVSTTPSYRARRPIRKCDRRLRCSASILCSAGFGAG